MPEERTFNVRWIKEGGKPPAELDAAADATVEYKGAEVTVVRTRESSKMRWRVPFCRNCGKTFVTRGVLY